MGLVGDSEDNQTTRDEDNQTTRTTRQPGGPDNQDNQTAGMTTRNGGGRQRRRDDWGQRPQRRKQRQPGRANPAPAPATASNCSQGGRRVLATARGHDDDEDKGDERTTGATGRVQQPSTMTANHHSTPNHRCEQLLAGWKWGAARRGMLGRTGGTTTTVGGTTTMRGATMVRGTAAGRGMKTGKMMMAASQPPPP